MAKLHYDPNTVVGLEAAGRLEVDATPQMFRILSSDLYSRPLEAICREICTNAADIHRATNQLKPFDVSLPTVIEPVFSVRDYGTGLTPDQIRSEFTVYGRSTKVWSDVETGCLGLGCKSPLGYAEQFTVTSYQDGTATTYSIHWEDDLPTYAVVSSASTDEPDGLEVCVPVKADDIRKMHHAAHRALKAFDCPLNVDGELYNSERYFLASDDDAGWEAGMWKSETDSAPISIVMGGVAYPLDIDALAANIGENDRGAAIAARLHELFSTNKIQPQELQFVGNLYIKVPIGAVDFTPNREELRYTVRTTSYLSTLFVAVSNKMTADHAAASLFDASKTATEKLREFWYGALTKARGDGTHTPSIDLLWWMVGDDTSITSTYHTVLDEATVEIGKAVGISPDELYKWDRLQTGTAIHHMQTYLPFPSDWGTEYADSRMNKIPQNDQLREVATLYTDPDHQLIYGNAHNAVVPKDIRLSEVPVVSPFHWINVKGAVVVVAPDKKASTAMTKYRRWLNRYPAHVDMYSRCIIVADRTIDEVKRHFEKMLPNGVRVIDQNVGSKANHNDLCVTLVDLASLDTAINRAKGNARNLDNVRFKRVANHRSYMTFDYGWTEFKNANLSDGDIAKLIVIPTRSHKLDLTSDPKNPEVSQLPILCVRTLLNMCGIDTNDMVVTNITDGKLLVAAGATYWYDLLSDEDVAKLHTASASDVALQFASDSLLKSTTKLMQKYAPQHSLTSQLATTVDKINKSTNCDVTRRRSEFELMVKRLAAMRSIKLEEPVLAKEIKGLVQELQENHPILVLSSIVGSSYYTSAIESKSIEGAMRQAYIKES